MIVEGKHGLGKESIFEFQYVPMLHKTTKLEVAPASDCDQPGAIWRILSAAALLYVALAVLKMAVPDHSLLTFPSPWTWIFSAGS